MGTLQDVGGGGRVLTALDYHPRKRCFTLLRAAEIRIRSNSSGPLGTVSGDKDSH